MVIEDQWLSWNGIRALSKRNDHELLYKVDRVHKEACKSFDGCDMTWDFGKSLQDNYNRFSFRKKVIGNLLPKVIVRHFGRQEIICHPIETSMYLCKMMFVVVFKAMKELFDLKQYLAQDIGRDMMIYSPCYHGGVG